MLEDNTSNTDLARVDTEVQHTLCQLLTCSSTSSILKTLVDWVPPLLKDLLGPFFTNLALTVQFML